MLHGVNLYQGQLSQPNWEGGRERKWKAVTSVLKTHYLWQLFKQVVGLSSPHARIYIK